MSYFAGKINADDLVTISNFLPQIGHNDVAEEIITGLTSEQKYISSKYFYNERGSKLFEEITRLEEYYLTRTEASILYRIAPVLTVDLENYNIIELGSGDCKKISVLFDAFPLSKRELVHYYPIDVSYSAIQNSANKLLRLYPEITIHGIIADFISQFNLIPKVKGRLVCFFGSTIGNLDVEHASRFLITLSENMNTGDQLLLGLDMVKAKNVIEAAYNDSKKVTATFNRNILSVVNSIVETDFDTNSFEHLAFFNEEDSRIEMHLKARESMSVSCPLLNEKIKIRRGEMIHTENSYKYTLKHIDGFAASSGLTVKNIFSDENNWFSLIQFVK